LNTNQAYDDMDKDREIKSTEYNITALYNKINELTEVVNKLSEKIL